MSSETHCIGFGDQDGAILEANQVRASIIKVLWSLRDSSHFDGESQGISLLFLVSKTMMTYLSC